jgi:hypothetical protein
MVTSLGALDFAYDEQKNVLPRERNEVTNRGATMEMLGADY